MSRGSGESVTSHFYRTPTRDDVGWLLKLHLDTMAPHIAASGQKLSVDDHKARIEQDFDSIRIIQLASKDVGMVKLVRGEREWELVQIQLQPRHQGSGIGTAVVSEMITRAREAGVPLRLSVLKVNPARRLYERLGFEIVGETTRSYQMCIGTGDGC